MIAVKFGHAYRISNIEYPYGDRFSSDCLRCIHLQSSLTDKFYTLLALTSILQRFVTSVSTTATATVSIRSNSLFMHANCKSNAHLSH